MSSESHTWTIWKDYTPEVVVNTIRTLKFTIACECARDNYPAKQRINSEAVCWNGSVRSGKEVVLLLPL